MAIIQDRYGEGFFKFRTVYHGLPYDALRTTFGKYEEAHRRAARGIVFSLYEQAQIWSSGPYRLEILRLMGHPYSRRNPRPPMPAYIINVQSGMFKRGWRIGGGRYYYALFNISPTAAHIISSDEDVEYEGRMMRRPIFRELHSIAMASFRAGRRKIDVIGRQIIRSAQSKVKRM